LGIFDWSRIQINNNTFTHKIKITKSYRFGNVKQKGS
jgi:hypothetical protein